MITTGPFQNKIANSNLGPRRHPNTGATDAVKTGALLEKKKLLTEWAQDSIQLPEGFSPLPLLRLPKQVPFMKKLLPNRANSIQLPERATNELSRLPSNDK